MPAKQSFDIITECDLQEVDNAVNQAQKELDNRYDFRGVEFEIDFKRSDNTIVLDCKRRIQARCNLGCLIW